MSGKQNEITKEMNSPTDMISQALASGADLDKLEKLLTIKERWDANEARKEYHEAMSEFKSNPPKITKDKKVGYSTSKGDVGYSHASLGNIIDQVTKELSKHGLSVSWRTKQNGNVIVTCVVTHKKGHSEDTSLSADSDTTGSKNSIQAMGSTITYLQRYTLLSMLGLATEDQDNDGASSGVTLVSDKQISSMLDILDGLYDPKEKKKKFFKYMGIESMGEIKESDYTKGMNALKQSQGKANKNENN